MGDRRWPDPPDDPHARRRDVPGSAGGRCRGAVAGPPAVGHSARLAYAPVQRIGAMRLHVAFLPSLAATGRSGSERSQVCLVVDVIRASSSLVTIVARGDDLAVVCAGREGAFSIDDAYCAGYLADALLAYGSADLTDGAIAALRLYRSEPDALAIFSQSAAARNVVRLGLTDDVAYCAQRNVSEVVPRLGRELYLVEEAVKTSRLGTPPRGKAT